MQSNSLSKLIVIFGLLLVSVYMVFDVFASGGNAVAQFYRYGMIAGGVLGLLNPRAAFYVLIGLTAYLDFAKRLMILDSGVSKMDLYYVLGVSPAVVCGIAANVLYAGVTGTLEGRPGLLKLAVGTLFAAGILGAGMVLGSTSRFQALGDAVNGVVYLLLLPVVPMLFRTPGEIRDLLKAAVWIYVPAVIYMLLHWFRATILGMNPPIFDWELAYVKSGMTIEVRQLAARQFRPFGTFNSAANASMVFAAFLGLVWAGFWRKPYPGNPNGGGVAGRSILGCMVVLAIYATYSRTGWVFGGAIVAAAIMFRFRLATTLAYACGILAALALVFGSSYLLKYKILNEISQDLYSLKRTDEWAQVTNIATMNDRLEGFNNLMKNSRVWTPFGFKLAYGSSAESVQSGIFVHDALSVAVMKFGYVPLAAAGIFFVVMLKRLHGFIFRERDPLVRGMAATCLAGTLVLASGTLVNSAQLLTYPVNFWIWFLLSCVVALKFWRENEGAEVDSEAVAMPPQSGPRTLSNRSRSQPALV